jgi:hypothetical protein
MGGFPALAQWQDSLQRGNGGAWAYLLPPSPEPAWPPRSASRNFAQRPVFRDWLYFMIFYFCNILPLKKSYNTNRLMNTNNSLIHFSPPSPISQRKQFPLLSLSLLGLLHFSIPPLFFSTSTLDGSLGFCFGGRDPPPLDITPASPHPFSQNSYWGLDPYTEYHCSYTFFFLKFLSFLSFFGFLFFFEIGSSYAAQAGLQLTILLPQSPELRL